METEGQLRNGNILNVPDPDRLGRPVSQMTSAAMHCKGIGNASNAPPNILVTLTSAGEVVQIELWATQH